MMAADSDGYSITTVVTCEGDLADPNFPGQLEKVLDKLQFLLGGKLSVRKLEPWNSVRVTLSIPREAAIRLRHLASEGSQHLRALGILSVQVEGDQVISLRLAGPEPQEIILRTTTQQDESTPSTSSTNPSVPHVASGTSVSNTATVNTPEKIQFRSPNVVCPTDTVVPKVPAQNIAAASTSAIPNRQFTTPFPFTSMNQAIRGGENATPSSSSLGTTYNSTPTTPQLPPPPPPPYPGRPPPPITISSPLLVNLLQNDGGTLKSCKTEFDTGFSASSNSNTPSTMPTNSGSSAATCSTAMLKYSLLSGPQENANVKDPVSLASPPPFVKRTVPNVKPSVSNGPSNFVNLTNSSSHPSVLSTASVTQCNSLVTGSNSNMQQNHLMHIPNNNLSNSLQSTATVLPTNNSAPNTNSRPPTSNNHLLHQNNNTFQSVKAANENPAALSQGLNHMMPGAIVKTQQQCVPSNSLAMVNSSGTMNRNAVTRMPVNSFNNRPCAPISSSYSSRNFEPIAQPMPQLVDLTPSLTELKSSDLDQLLPSLESDIARSPPNLPEELTSTHDSRYSYLINPLTGELEPHINTESDNEETGPNDIFTGLPSPVMSSDEDTNPISRTDTTDQSDSESRSNHSDSSKNSRLKGSKSKERGRDSPNLKPTEKIKLRLKLEKSEPVSSAYKVDVSYINMTASKKSSASIGTSGNAVSTGPGEEPRVPPLHISLRGRNHVVINNRKKSKLSSSSGIDGLSKPSKGKKLLPDGSGKIKKNSLLKESLLMGSSSSSEQSVMSAEDGHSSLVSLESPTKNKVKKIKLSHEHREQALLSGGHITDKDINRHANFNSHFKERRGSDSELAHSIKRYTEINGISSGDKKRRLSHTDQAIDLESQLFVLGSTNVGTVTALPTQKLRKDKIKLKESKSKELNRNKSYVKNMVEKFKQTSLPTAGDMDMEAKFKQRLLEDLVKSSGVSQPMHRIENNIQETPSVLPNQYSHNDDAVEELVKTLTTTDDPPPLKDKPPELAKNEDRKPDLAEKQVGRSPNSGGQGEDSGIESMDALSEKSPNQASQSPHTDITSESVKSKPQVPSILDIEAQLAKMEGLNGEDLNENKHDTKAKIQQCCGGLTSVLQDSFKQGSLSPHMSTNIKEELPHQIDENLIQLKPPKNEPSTDPQPIRVSPPLFTYSNTEKTRDSESPMSDSDSNSCGQHLIIKNKSLLEQLLIDIPDNQSSSSISPATRSLRTRASSKLSSPELNSPVVPPKPTRIPILKRKRRESESSNNSVEDSRNKKSRKCSENTLEMIKVCVGIDQPTKPCLEPNSLRKKLGEDSSDSDEPLIEVAGKVRKINNDDDNSIKTKFKTTTTTSSFVDSIKAAPVKTRSSVRTTMPALNTRSKGDKVQSNASILRRKTRSTVTEVEGKRRKDVK